LFAPDWPTLTIETSPYPAFGQLKKARMENVTTGNLPKNGQTITDKVDDVGGELTPALKKAISRAQSMGRQSIDAVSDMTRQARDAAANASDSIVAYTRKKPVTALAIAAASGALIYAAVKALTPSRK
jgi:ElaB/YqjD/DUF883 family membrane-anchored ribosome-binding protein